MSAPALNAPKTAAAAAGRTTRWSWIFMRVSWHRAEVPRAGPSVDHEHPRREACSESTSFVAGRWSSPSGRWDLLQLWLAMIHGANALRTIINDYSKSGTRPGSGSRRHS